MSGPPIFWPAPWASPKTVRVFSISMSQRSRFFGLSQTTIAAAAILVTVGLGCQVDRDRRERPKESGPNPVSVLLVTVDTLRADHLSAYGYGLPTSPAIERLADDGVLFANAFSGSACTAPSTASIMVGAYPSFHTVGVLNGLFELDDSSITLAEVMSANGYRTGAIIGNPVLRAAVGFDQGFETYDDDLEGRELNRPRARERTADRVVDLAIRRGSKAPTGGRAFCGSISRTRTGPTRRRRAGIHSAVPSTISRTPCSP